MLNPMYLCPTHVMAMEKLQPHENLLQHAALGKRFVSNKSGCGSINLLYLPSQLIGTTQLWVSSMALVLGYQYHPYSSHHGTWFRQALAVIKNSPGFSRGQVGLLRSLSLRLGRCSSVAISFGSSSGSRPGSLSAAAHLATRSSVAIVHS